MSEKWWRHTFDKIEEPIEKFNYLVGLSDLCWEDCCDAWYESVKLMSEISSYAEKLRADYDKIQAALHLSSQKLADAEKRIEQLEAALKEIRDFCLDLDSSYLAEQALKGGEG